MAAADEYISHLHHGVRRVRAAGGQGEWIRQGQDALHHRERGKNTGVRPIRLP